MIYFLVILLLFYFIAQFDLSGRYRNRKLCYNFVLFVLIAIAGMRYRIGVDSTNYVYDFFHNTPLLYNLNYQDEMFVRYPLWVLLNSFVYTLGGKYFIVQFVQAAIVNTLLFAYFEKHSKYIFSCVLLYFIWMYPSFCFEEMKASLGIVFLLFANDFILEKKYMKGIGLGVFACFFHFSLFLLLLCSFITMLKLNKVGFGVIVLAVFVGITLKETFVDYLMLFDFNEAIYAKLEGYSESSRFFGMEDKNINYYIVHHGSIVLYPILSLFILKYTKSYTLLRLESYVVWGLIFVAIGFSIVIAYRYVHFYSVYFILFMIQAYMEIRKSKTISKKVGSLIPLVLILPFLFYLSTTYFTMGTNRYRKFYPYSSIIDREVDKEREAVFNENELVASPRPNEY